MTIDPRDAIRKNVAEGMALLERAFEEFGIKPGDHVGRPELTFNVRAAAIERIAGPPAAPCVPEMVAAARDLHRCGCRPIALALIVTRIHMRFREFEEAGEAGETWRSFLARSLPALDLATANEMVRRVTREPVEAAEQVQRTALDRALDALCDDDRRGVVRSNRAIAAEIGVDRQTVRRARRALAENVAHSPPDSPPTPTGGTDAWANNA